jgi:hypothetical protein
MVKLRARRLYTDRNEPMKKEIVDDICKKTLETLKGYGLSFLNGFECRKEKMDKYYIIDGPSTNGVSSELCGKNFARRFRNAKRPYLVFTPIGILLYAETTIDVGLTTDTRVGGYANSMFSIVDELTLRSHDAPYGLILHELGHSVYGLQHEHEEETSCAMVVLDSSSPPARLCKDCQTKARKVDEELRQP